MLESDGKMNLASYGAYYKIIPNMLSTFFKKQKKNHIRIFFKNGKKTAINKVQHFQDWEVVCLVASHLISLIKNLIHDDSFDD